MEKYGEKLKKIRLVLGLSQRELADKLGIAQGLISNYERGRNNPSAGVVSLIVSTFGVSYDWMYAGIGPMFNSDNDGKQLDILTSDLIKGESKSFKTRLISVLGSLTDEQWEILAAIAKKISEEHTDRSKKYKSIPPDDNEL